MDKTKEASGIFRSPKISFASVKQFGVVTKTVFTVVETGASISGPGVPTRLEKIQPPPRTCREFFYLPMFIQCFGLKQYGLHAKLHSLAIVWCSV